MATPEGAEVLERLEAVLRARRQADPEASYVARLHQRGNDAICKKVGEEATEVVMAAKDGVVGPLVAEVADLWFHSLVLLHHHGCGGADVLAELERRFGTSGLTEKASRARD